MIKLETDDSYAKNWCSDEDVRWLFDEHWKTGKAVPKLRCHCTEHWCVDKCPIDKYWDELRCKSTIVSVIRAMILDGLIDPVTERSV